MDKMMKSMTNEKLVDRALEAEISINEMIPIRAELLSRLNRGQKAIEAMEKIREIHDNWKTHDVITDVEDILAEY
jgi:hypothetical protein